jgi:lipopolysaccharide heptosyltransferase III
MGLPRLALPARPRILVVTLRRLGDVLLTTPLIRSIRNAWRDAIIDALVFEDTAAILVGNPDLDGIVSMPPRPRLRDTVMLAAKLLRRYDLAVSTQSGDRPAAFAILAGKVRAGLVEDRLGGRVKRVLLQRAVTSDPRAHRVEAVLRLADALGIVRASGIVPPWAAWQPPEQPYAVVHAAPFFNYKRWTIAGWRALAQALARRGLTVIATGGPSPAERGYLDEVWRGMPVRRCDGALGWGELAALLAAARIYVGPDTSVTHLAAATGCTTVALYGPTDPRLWGPWPAGGLCTAWTDATPVQNRGNVWLVHHVFPCTPCQLEGCERNVGSFSACLNLLTTVEVIAAVEQALTAAGKPENRLP